MRFWQAKPSGDPIACETLARHLRDTLQHLRPRAVGERLGREERSPSFALFSVETAM